MAKIVKKKLKIEGMHCTSCAINIDFDLEDLEGVEKCQTSYAKQESEVEFDEEKIKLQQILEQIQKTGYNCFAKNPLPQSGMKAKKVSSFRLMTAKQLKA